SDLAHQGTERDQQDDPEGQDGPFGAPARDQSGHAVCPGPGGSRALSAHVPLRGSESRYIASYGISRQPRRMSSTIARFPTRLPVAPPEREVRGRGVAPPGEEPWRGRLQALQSSARRRLGASGVRADFSYLRRGKGGPADTAVEVGAAQGNGTRGGGRRGFPNRPLSFANVGTPKRRPASRRACGWPAVAAGVARVGKSAGRPVRSDLRASQRPGGPVELALGGGSPGASGP